MLKFALLAAVVLVPLSQAWAQETVQDTDGTDGEIQYASCGADAPYGSAPLFQLTYQAASDGLLAGTTMAVTHFQPTAPGATGPASVTQPCRVTEISFANGTLSLGNPTQGCQAEIRASAAAAGGVDVVFAMGQGRQAETFTACSAKQSPADLGTALKSSDAFVAAPAPAVTVYDTKMSLRVRPFYTTGIDGSFPGVGGFKIAYKIWKAPNEQGAVVLLPGRGDAFATFDETIYDLAQKGYSVYAMDERGQGASQRLLPDAQLGYVDSFENYVADLKTFVDTVVGAHSRRFLLAHSMGGAIAARYGDEHATDFTAIVLVAPMLKINPAPYTMLEAELLDFIEREIGRSQDYAPGQTDYDPNATFAQNILTTSEPRWDNLHAILNGNPVLQLGGATVGWVHESFAADDTIHEQASAYAPSTLMLTAGNDQLVDVAEQAYFCSHAMRCEQAPIYTMAMHNILAEQDATRDDALARIFAFFDQHPAQLWLPRLRPLLRAG